MFKKKETTPKSKIAIGWREWLSLPDLQVKNIKAKIDTGARTSAIHVSHAKVQTVGRKKRVTFKVHPNQDSRFPEIACQANLVEMRNVKSSTGVTTLRPVIRTKMEIGGKNWDIELTLVNRDMMGFRMLLGRQAMRGRLVVDPARSFLTKGKRRKKKGENNQAAKNRR